MSPPRAKRWDRTFRGSDNYAGVVSRAVFRGTSADEIVKVLRDIDAQKSLTHDLYDNRLIFRERGRRIMTAKVRMPPIFPKWSRTDRAIFNDNLYYVVDSHGALQHGLNVFDAVR